ncbi:MAG TPA: hypothetical protein VFN74_03695, partial [Chloroflexota bacterium]|nr:hypothetical protein [Chloroflexota bacterium]
AAVVVGVLLRLVLPARGPSAGAGTAPNAAELLRTYAPLLKAPTARGVQGIMLGAALRNVTAWGMLTYLGAFLAQRHDFGQQQIGWAFLAIGAGHFTGSLAIGGRLVPGGGPSLRAAFGVLHLLAGVLVGGAFALPLPVAGAAALFVVAAVVLGAADVVTTRVLVAETPAGRATTLTLNGSATSLGGALGGSLGGALLSLSGFGALGTLLCATGGVAAGAVWLSRPRAVGPTERPAHSRSPRRP